MQATAALVEEHCLTVTGHTFFQTHAPERVPYRPHTSKIKFPVYLPNSLFPKKFKL